MTVLLWKDTFRRLQTQSDVHPLDPSQFPTISIIPGSMHGAGLGPLPFMLLIRFDLSLPPSSAILFGTSQGLGGTGKTWFSGVGYSVRC